MREPRYLTIRSAARRTTLGGDGCALTTLAYGVAHFGKSLFWYASEILFAFFLTEVAGLSGRHMGFALAIGLTLSAVFDPVVGLLAGKALADAKRSIRLQLVGSFLSAAALLALLSTPWVTVEARLAYAITTGVGFRLAYAFYDLPQNALISLATQDPKARTRVTSLRVVFSALAAFVVATAIGPLAVAHTTASGARWPLFALGLALSAGAMASSGMFWVVGRSISDGRPSTPTNHLRRPMALPRPCLLPISLAFVMSLTLPLFSKLLPYLATYSFRSTFWPVLISCAVPTGSALSQLGWSALSSRRPRIRVISLSCVVAGLGGIAFWCAVPSTPIAAVLAALAIGSGSGGLAMTVWAAFGDAFARVPGREGWGFGLFTASLKMGLAIGGFALGIVLENTNFRVPDNFALAHAMALSAIAGGLSCLLMIACWPSLAMAVDDPSEEIV